MTTDAALPLMIMTMTGDNDDDSGDDDANDHGYGDGIVAAADSDSNDSEDDSHNNGGKNDDDDSNVDFKLAFDCFQFLQTQRRKCCLTDFFSSSIFIFNVVYRLALVSSYGEPVPSAQLLKC